MYVAASMPNVLPQEDRYTPPDTAPWLALLNYPHKPAEHTDVKTAASANEPIQVMRPDSTSYHQLSASRNHLKAEQSPPHSATDTSTSANDDALSVSGGTDNNSATSGSGGSGSASSSRRTVFTRRQLAELEARFREQTFLSKEERADMADELQLTERQIMIWFQNRRGRLKRRGPSDNAYTAEKLKELNTRRPYPFLYGLLSSMQYRYPEGHQHPYQHLVSTDEQLRHAHHTTIQSSTLIGHNKTSTCNPSQQPLNAFTTGAAHHPRTSPSGSTLSPPPHPSSNTSDPAAAPEMPPNVTVHQMSWSSQPTTSPSGFGTTVGGGARLLVGGGAYQWSTAARPIRHQHFAHHSHNAHYQQPHALHQTQQQALHQPMPKAQWPSSYNNHIHGLQQQQQQTQVPSSQQQHNVPNWHLQQPHQQQSHLPQTHVSYATHSTATAQITPPSSASTTTELKHSLVVDEGQSTTPPSYNQSSSPTSPPAITSPTNSSGSTDSGSRDSGSPPSAGTQAVALVQAACVGPQPARSTSGEGGLLQCGGGRREEHLLPLLTSSGHHYHLSTEPHYAATTGYTASTAGADFNPQIDFGYVPDFPDITTSLFPGGYTSTQTC